jgi:hypothetical protein
VQCNSATPYSPPGAVSAAACVACATSNSACNGTLGRYACLDTSWGLFFDTEGVEGVFRHSCFKVCEGGGHRCVVPSRVRRPRLCGLNVKHWFLQEWWGRVPAVRVCAVGATAVACSVPVSWASPCALLPHGPFRPPPAPPLPVSCPLCLLLQLVETFSSRSSAMSTCASLDSSHLLTISEVQQPSSPCLAQPLWNRSRRDPVHTHPSSCRRTNISVLLRVLWQPFAVSSSLVVLVCVRFRTRLPPCL